jgi:hypothetical protein
VIAAHRITQETFRHTHDGQPQQTVIVLGGGRRGYTERKERKERKERIYV